MPLNPLDRAFHYFGWMGIGVEAFFVLSGFLIGRIIMRTLFKPSISWKSVRIFWVNRWLRTLPAYLAAFAAHYVFSEATHNRIFYLFFAQNIVTPMPGFFSHSWSLAVEEWFYLTFPVCLLAIAGITGRYADRYRVYLGGVCCFIIFGLIIKTVYNWAYHHDIFAWLLDRRFLFPSWHSFTGPKGDWDSMRKMVPFRIDAIAYGCLVAYVLERFTVPVQVRVGLFVAGIVCLASSFLIMTHTIAGGKASALSDIILLPLFCCSFALMLPLAESCPKPGKVTTAVITGISLTSYSFYLMHLLILDLVIHWYKTNEGTTGVPQGLVFIGTYLVIYLVSYVMYSYIELPFMNLRKKLVKDPARVTSV